MLEEVGISQRDIDGINRINNILKRLNTHEHYLSINNSGREKWFVEIGDEPYQHKDLITAIEGALKKLDERDKEWLGGCDIGDFIYYCDKNINIFDAPMSAQITNIDYKNKKFTIDTYDNKSSNFVDKLSAYLFFKERDECADYIHKKITILYNDAVKKLYPDKE